MFLKPLIVFFLIGVIVSLFTGLGFLFKDSGQPESKRTLYALGIRICFAAALLDNGWIRSGDRPAGATRPLVRSLAPVYVRQST